MKKFKNIIKCFIFIMILCVILMGASFVLMPKDNRKEFGMTDVVTAGLLGEKENSIDILIVGDSECYYTFSPMSFWKEYGYTSFMCANAAQNFASSYKYIKSALERQKPKVIVLDVNGAYTTGGFKKDLNDALARKARYFISLLEYHNRWKSLSTYDFLKSPEYTYTSDFKGYDPRTKVEPWNGEEYMIDTTEKEKINAIPMFYLNEIFNICRDNDIELLLTSVPSPKNWNAKRHNEIQAFADENSLTYLDMNYKNYELNIDWKTETPDAGDHLNFGGSKKIIKYFGKYLKDNYNLEDKRGNIEYKIWNENIDRYNKFIESKGK